MRKPENKRTVSVIIPTYNRAHFLSEAIQSVLDQTHRDFEIIVIDDSSTDNTEEVVKGFGDERVRYIQFEKNSGSSTVPRATGINAVEDEYIALLDSDDYWTDPDKLQKQVDFLKTNPSFSMCFANSKIIDDEGNVINSSRVPNNYKRNITQKDILSGFVPPSNTMLIKSEYLKSIIPLMSNRVRNGDYFISCLMAEYGEIGYIDDNVAAYRKHDKGIWSAASEYERDISLFNLFDILAIHIKNNKDVVRSKAANTLRKLQRENMDDLFLEDNHWTPQTAMLRSIRDLVIKMNGDPVNSLSIDTNPSLEKILLRKWPRLQIDYAKYPEHDVQNLYNFQDESFDIVFSHQVLEHVPKPWIAAKEIVRILKKGGIGIHSSCAFNPRHGYPVFKDYYRFLPDGLAELFDGVNIWLKDGWGSKEALIYNLTVDDGHKELGGRRFSEALGNKNDLNYPWHTWVIFQKL
jgi:glycosyltransferase involved in cell wall biosynthesis